ncbi:hypothetical protein B7988_07125 [Fibrobacter sp. UWB1]|uniref:hypothetical protein n=1 Tax=Fibrobacter sp. UWB1 TaxID=1964355 RepID=UPI000B5250DC|nr:hypothetical protein [Fibrobacter sp. UWB1]OWV26081.1 hypothetical protein B7988_07125 [Fibrobacter sp. UWB1]
MSFSKTLAIFVCATAFCFAANDSTAKTQAPAILQEEMLIFKTLLQTPLFKDNFIQSCAAQSVEWLGASQADKTCNCAFDRLVKDGKFINQIMSSINGDNIDFEKWGFEFIEPCIPQSFPAETDNAFVKECLKAGDVDKATCECVLKSIKKDYSVRDLMKTAFKDQKKLEIDIILKSAQCLSK